MAKTMTFSYAGKDYTLEFSKATVRQMEAKGFVANDMQDKPMTVLPDLFAGAFLMHHRFVKQDVIEDIYNHLPDKDKLVGALAEMYNEPIEKLMAEPENPKENVAWAVNW